MRTRPAWGILFVGAVIVGALLASPLWIDRVLPYLQDEDEALPFPPAFYELPLETQERYNAMYGDDEQMAIDFVAARLAAPEELEEPYLPGLDADPGAVQRLLGGNFVTVDPIRSATGTATIYRLSDGRWLLRIEDLDALNGPELHVLLSAFPNPTTPEDLAQLPRLQIDLGALKATQGNQNYFIEDPAFNPDNYVQGSIVIYSARYSTVFSYAPLAPSTGSDGS
ncbi:MAG: DM13 domain-containing protein [Chloroflexi bacterium]|nr:DM13 domain-containing protein [Chloroflexota bacterium]